MSGLLGVGDDYRVQVSDKLGGASLSIGDEDGLVEVRWGRLFDRPAPTRFRVATSGCCDKLDRLSTVTQEATVVRDGDDQTVGPVVTIDRGREFTTVTGSDRAWWLARRFVSTLQSTLPADQIAAQILEQTVGGRDPGLGSRPVIASAPFFINPGVAQDDYATGAEVLADVAAVGLDWTMYKEQFRAGQTIPTADLTPIRLPPLTGDHIIGEPTWRERGDLYATRVVYVGGDGTVVSVDVTDLGFEAPPRECEVEIRVTDDTISDPYALVEAARNELAARYPAPVEFSLGSAARLSPKAPICMDQLIPGAVGPVTIREICGAGPDQIDMVLTGLQVTRTRDGERVQIAMQPHRPGVA